MIYCTSVLEDESNLAFFFSNKHLDNMRAWKLKRSSLGLFFKVGFGNGIGTSLKAVISLLI